MTHWQCVLELDSSRNVVAGSPAVLADAIGRAADLRVGTEFRHNEHIDVTSPSNEPIREVAEFGITCRIAQSWAAGIMSLRQPIQLPEGFGPRPSMSFFLYNQDGTQAIARPYLDGQPASGKRGPSPVTPSEGMPKYHAADNWDEGTSAPSHNFVYDFDVYRYHINDNWREVFSHTSTGEVVAGSLSELTEAFRDGCEIKLGLVNVCADLASESRPPLEHELFVQGGSGYFYTERKQFIIGTHPVVRVAPAVPLKYASGNWDFGWLMVRTDGHVVYRRCDPHTLQFSDQAGCYAVRWFVR